MSGRGRTVPLSVLYALLALTVPGVAAPAAPLGASSLFYDVRASVIVLDAESAGRALTGWAEQVGGYFLLRSLESVVLRVPAEKVSDLKAAIQKASEAIVSYEPSARDVREELAGVQSALTSREEELALVLRYLDGADVAGTLALENEIARLMTDIESLEGQRRRLENEAAYARVQITLSSRRQTVPTRRPSSFAWINTVDLYRFIPEVLPNAR